MHQFLFCNEFILHLYMFRAQLCSSSGGQNFITNCIRCTGASDGLLQSVTMPDVL